MGINTAVVLRELPAELWHKTFPGPTCRFGPDVGPALKRIGHFDLVYDCESVLTCFDLALEHAEAGVKCSKIRVQSDILLPAASYLATSSTRIVRGRGADGGSCNTTSDATRSLAFTPQFLAAMPSPLLARTLREAPMVLAMPPVSRCGAPPRRYAEFRAGACQHCRKLAARARAMMASWANSNEELTRLYWERARRWSQEADLAHTSTLNANASTLLENPNRMLVQALVGPNGIKKGTFGVIVGDERSVPWYVALARAAGADERTRRIYELPYHEDHFSTRSDRSTVTLRWAIPHRADFIIIPSGVLGRNGFNMRMGIWNERADFELMKTVRSALRVGGLVYAVMEVGFDCTILSGDAYGAAERIYGNRYSRLLEDWERVEELSPEEPRCGLCRSEPRVLVLRSLFERHPVSLLSAERVDIIPKLLYALHYKGIGKEENRQSNPFSSGEWARQLYMNSVSLLNQGRELCQYHVQTFGHGLEPCVDKLSTEEFQASFDSLLESIAAIGFSRSISAIHMTRPGDAKGGFLVNGAHRVAAAVAMDFERVPVMFASGILIPVGMHLTWWLSAANAPPKVSLALSVILMELSRRLAHPSAAFELYVLFVWPVATAKGIGPEIKQALVDGEVGWVVDMQHRDVELSASGCLLLIEQLYVKEPWIHDASRVDELARNVCGYPGKPQAPGLIILLSTRSGSKSKVLQVKASLESRYYVPDHGLLYASNDPESAVAAIAALMHPPTRSFLNAAFSSTPPRLRDRLPRNMGMQKLADMNAQQHCVVTGGAVLQVHGLLKTDSIELICDGSIDVSSSQAIVDVGASEWLVAYGMSRDDVIHDPANYFICDGWRFVTHEQLSRTKRTNPDHLNASAIELEAGLYEIAALERMYKTS